MEEAIKARFPHLAGLFVYHRGSIAAVDGGFSWDGWSAEQLRSFMLSIVFDERKNISRHVDFDAFLWAVRGAMSV